MKPGIRVDIDMPAAENNWLNNINMEDIHIQVISRRRLSNFGGI
jgi:hypothetical protein